MKATRLGSSTLSFSWIKSSVFVRREEVALTCNTKIPPGPALLECGSKGDEKKNRRDDASTQV